MRNLLIITGTVSKSTHAQKKEPDIFLGFLSSGKVCAISAPPPTVSAEASQSIGSLSGPFQEAINQNSGREASHYLQLVAPCVLSPRWHFCIIFPPQRKTGGARPVIMCSFSSLRFEPFRRSGFIFCACGKLRAEWVLDSEEWGSEIMNVCVDPLFPPSNPSKLGKHSPSPLIIHSKALATAVSWSV